MNLYQAGYYRLGGRGSGAGWKLVAPSAGMSEIAKAGFRGIAAKLVDVGQRDGQPEALGIFGHDRFFYLMHVNYAAVGEDSRGVAYVHGYCFHQAEYYELAKQPEMLFGVLRESFDQEYRPELVSYPVVQSLPYRSMNERRLLDQYQISTELYRAMLLGTVCAMEGYGGALCVKCTVPLEQYTQVYQDLLYLIMKGLPYHLRQKLLSCSLPGIQTMVFVSDTVIGDTFADLDTGSWQCDTKKLDSYQFTRLYNTDLFYNSKDAREQVFAAIAAFVDEVFTDPLKHAGCALIEAGFQKCIKKNDGGIDPEQAPLLMQEFLNMDLLYGEETAVYLAALLEPLNQNGMQITDQTLSVMLAAAYEKCLAQETARAVQSADGLPSGGMYELTGQMSLLFAYRILAQRREQGFDALQKLQHTNADDLYPEVCRYLEQIDAQFFADYYWNYFLPRALTTLKKAEVFLLDHGRSFSQQEQQSFQKLLKKLVEREMQGAESFEELAAWADTIGRLRQGVPYLDREGQLLEETYFVLWNCFDLEWFDLEQTARYKQYQVQKSASPNAQKISRLLAGLEAVRRSTDVHRMWDLLFENTQEADETLLRRIQRELQKEFFSNVESVSVWELDASLVLCYDAQKKQFDLVKWICEWADRRRMQELTGLFAEYEKASSLFQWDRHRECLIRCLGETLKGKKQSAYGRLPDDRKKALQLLYRAFRETDREKSTGRGLFYIMHREVLGFFALLSLAFCEICLRRYGSTDSRFPLALVSFAAACFLAVLVIKAVAAGRQAKNKTPQPQTDQEMPDNEETGGVLASCVVVMLLVMMISAAAAVYFLDGFLIKAGCVMGFLALAAFMALLNGLMTKE